MKLKLIGALALSAALLFADFRYETTTRITKGMVTKMAFGKKPEPTTTTTYMKGSRVATVSKDSTTIIDFDKQEFLMIDTSKRKYYSMTFAEMQQMMADAQNEMKKSSKDASLEMKFDAKATGVAKDVNGFPAKQVIFTIEPAVSDGKQSAGMFKLTTDSWHSEKVLGYSEYLAFYERLKDKGGWLSFASNPMAQMNGDKKMAEGMRRMAEEMQKTPGLPVLSISRMNMPGLNFGGGAQSSNGGNEPAPTVGSALGGALGGTLGGRFGGFGRKKKEEAPKEQPAPAASPAPQAADQGDGALFMESFSETGNFSTSAIDDAVFAVPAGFERTDSPFAKRKR
jgi:hypothetical protein